MWGKYFSWIKRVADLQIVICSTVGDLTVTSTERHARLPLHTTLAKCLTVCLTLMNCQLVRVLWNGGSWCRSWCRFCGIPTCPLCRQTQISDMWKWNIRCTSQLIYHIRLSQLCSLCMVWAFKVSSSPTRMASMESLHENTLYGRVRKLIHHVHQTAEGEVLRLAKPKPTKNAPWWLLWLSGAASLWRTFCQPAHLLLSFDSTFTDLYCNRLSV